MRSRMTVVACAIEGLAARPGLLFFLWALGLAFPYFGFGPSSFVWLPDNGDAYLPMQLAKADRLVRDQAGLWANLFVSGADGLSSLWVGEPWYGLFALMPGWAAYGLIMLCQRFLAGYFTYRLLRDFLALETMPALYAGLSYAFFHQGSINHQWAGFTLYDGLALPGLPFFLWALLRLDACRKGILLAGAAVLGVFLSVTSLYYFAVFLFPLVVAWCLWIVPRRGIFWVGIVVFALSWLLAEAPVFLAAYANSPLSFRSLWTPDSPLHEPLVLLEYHLGLGWHIISDNALSLALAFAGRVASGSRDRRLDILLGLFLFCLAYKIAYPFLIRELLPLLGPFKGFSFDRFYVLIPFLAAVSGALGLAAIGRRWELKLTRHPSVSRSLSLQGALFATSIGIILVQWAGVQRDILGEMGAGRNYCTLYRHPAIQEIAAHRDALSPFRVATLSANADDTARLHPGYAWAYGLETADGYVNLYSKRYHRFWEQLLEPLSLCDRSSFDRFRFSGTRLYLFAPDAGASGRRGTPPCDEFFHPGLLSLANVRFLISPRPVAQDGWVPLRSDRLAEQEAWAQRPKRDKLLGLVLGKYPGQPLYVYENKQVISRFFVTRRTRVLPGDADVLSALSRATREELASTAYLSEPDVRGLTFPARDMQGGTVRVRDYRADRVVLDVDAPTGGILVATNNHSPYWKATVDGSTGTLFPVNYTFQGVTIPSGRHEVVLSYEPPYAVLPWLSS